MKKMKVVEADVIVHIVDVSSESRGKQESAVTGVLREMGVANKPRMVVWNKLDLIQEQEWVRVAVVPGYFSLYASHARRNLPCHLLNCLCFYSSSLDLVRLCVDLL